MMRRSVSSMRGEPCGLRSRDAGASVVSLEVVMVGPRRSVEKACDEILHGNALSCMISSLIDRFQPN